MHACMPQEFGKIDGIIPNLFTEISTSKDKNFTCVDFIDTPGRGGGVLGGGGGGGGGGARVGAACPGAMHRGGVQGKGVARGQRCRSKSLMDFTGAARGAPLPGRACHI